MSGLESLQDKYNFKKIINLHDESRVLFGRDICVLTNINIFPLNKDLIIINNTYLDKSIIINDLLFKHYSSNVELLKIKLNILDLAINVDGKDIIQTKKYLKRASNVFDKVRKEKILLKNLYQRSIITRF